MPTGGNILSLDFFFVFMQLRQRCQYWPFRVVCEKLECGIIEVFLVTRNNTALCTASTLYMLGI